MDEDCYELRKKSASAHFPKSVLRLSTTFHGLRKVMGTSKVIDSRAAFYLKFLNGIRRLWCRNFKQAALDLLR